MQFPAFHQFLLRHGYVGSSPWQTRVGPSLGFFEIAATLDSSCRQCHGMHMRPLRYVEAIGTPIVLDGVTDIYRNSLAVRHCTDCDNAVIQDSWEMPLDIEVPMDELLEGRDYSPRCNRFSAAERAELGLAR
jgi:hypothetical protein